MQIIDELVIRLGLDPKGLTDGQRKVIESMRQLEARAGTSAKTVEATTGKSLRQMLGSYDQHFVQINKHLNDLSNQSRRTGSTVAQGAKAGAAGLTAMAAAGLSAYAALKSVQTVFDEVTKTAARNAQTGRVAQLSGVDPARLSRFSIAMSNLGNVPREQTESTIYNLRQQLETARRTGNYSDQLQNLQRFGVQLWKTDPKTGRQVARSPIEIALDAAARAQQLGGPAGANFLTASGLGALASPLQKYGRAGVNAEMSRIADIGITGAQTEQAQKLQAAINGVMNAWDGVWTSLETRVSPALVELLKHVESWLIAINKSPKALDAFGLALTGFTTLVAVTLVAKIAKAITEIGAAATRLPGGAGGPAAGGSGFGRVLATIFGYGAAGLTAATANPDLLDPNSPINKQRVSESNGWLNRNIPGMAWLSRKMGWDPGTGGDQPAPPPAGAGAGAGAGGAPSLWQRAKDAARAIGNAIIPSAAASTGPAGAAPAGASAATTGAVPPEAAGILRAIASGESEGAARRLGVSPYNVRYTPRGGAAFGDLSHHPRIFEPGPAGPSSAAGRYQFTATTWKVFARKLGLTDFSAASQDKAGWADAQGVYKRATGRDLGTDLKRNYFDPRAIPAFHNEWTSIHGDFARKVVAQTQAIRMAQGAGKGVAGSTTNNDNDTNFHPGSIVVHANNQDPMAVGGAVAHAISQRESLVARANTNLD